MAVYKCKMCGGTIEFEQGATVGVCDYCGTKQTLPKLDDDRRANLYDRANHFRRNNEFDKATGLYEQILNEDMTDSEAYWSLVLCKYGIEYVEDPTTYRCVPTVNRAQYTSIFDDENYKSALKYADIYQRSIYEEEAAAINDIQKGILAISQKEDPFDVFLCYKETDAAGRRTPDSVLANDLYHQLTQEGFKVFYSRITLEDKLGTAYEPYIFAALNSAKVMVVIGTKPEYFNAVWVKNEWSRYLSIVKASKGKKILIPAYRDMDPYDLPEEFSHLQAQDMSKLGFMQDLIRGIKKIVQVDEPKPAVKEPIEINAANFSAAPLLKRAFIFLEDGDWARADDFCEQVLNLDPENAKAYVGKLMAELHVRNQDDLQNCDKPFDNNSNFTKALRFGDEKLVLSLENYIKHINDRNENARRIGVYDQAVSIMNSAGNEASYKGAAELFRSISGFKDADKLAEQCLELAESSRKNKIYNDAESAMIGDKADSYESAIRLLHTISGWKDSNELIQVCHRKIEAIKAKEEEDRIEAERRAEQAQIEAERKAEEKRIASAIAAKKRKKALKIGVPILVCCIAIVLLLTQVIIPKQKHDKAMQMIKSSSVGSSVVFGTYEQDNDQSNGPEDIEWIVLSRDNDKLLVISRYALDCQPYKDAYNIDATWEDCSLRKWLNEEFLSDAFTQQEQNIISSAKVSADKNPAYDTDPGKSTEDKIFLLSISEANKYFKDDAERECVQTPYAAINGIHRDDGTALNNWWWLRSPGCESNNAAFVKDNGEISTYGEPVDYDFAVRPALWIDLAE